MEIKTQFKTTEQMNYPLQRSKTTCLNLDNRLKIKGTTAYYQKDQIHYHRATIWPRCGLHH